MTQQRPAETTDVKKAAQDVKNEEQGSQTSGVVGSKQKYDCQDPFWIFPESCALAAHRGLQCRRHAAATAGLRYDKTRPVPNCQPNDGNKEL